MSGDREEQDRIGSSVGPYRLHRRVGKGGMGTVYEAADERSGERVAVKFMSKQLVPSETDRKRFEREMIVAMMLDHPGIVSVVDFGEHEGEPYYVMEYVEGWPLSSVPRDVLLGFAEQRPAQPSTGTDASDLSRRGRAQDEKPRGPPTPAPPSLPTRDKTEPAIPMGYFRFVAGLGVQTAEALDYAHQQGVIHRDIKPSNLILLPDGRVKILDFGLAKAVELETLTSTGGFLGTPAYMSPEQAAGEVSQIDHRTDVYSLGITLYELLTWTKPFTGQTRLVTSAILHKQPVEPRKWNRRIPRPINAVVLKAIEKRREDRYQSAGEFAEDLQRYLSRKRVDARQGSLPWKMARAVKKKKKEALLASRLIVAMAVLLGGIWGYLFWRSRRYENLVAKATIAAGNNAFGDAIRYLKEALRFKETAEAKLKLWDAEGKRKRLLPGSIRRQGCSLAFSRSGRWLASGQANGHIRLWEVKPEVKARRLLGPHRGMVTALCFCEDENLLATADASGRVTVWDTASGARVASSKAPPLVTGAVVCTMAFMPGGKRLFMADEQGHVTVLDWKSDAEKSRPHPVAGRFVGSRIEAHQAGSFFAASGTSEDGESWAGVFDTETGIDTIRVGLAESSPSAVAASEHGDRLAVGYEDGSIELYSKGDISRRVLVHGGGRRVAKLCFFNEDANLLSCSDHGAMSVWDTVTTWRDAVIANGCGGLGAVAVAPKGRLAAVALSQGGVQLWETSVDRVLPSGKVLKPAFRADSGETFPLRVLGFSARGRFVGAGDMNGTVTVWETSNGSTTATIRGSGSPVTALAFSPKEESLLAYATRDEGKRPMICVYDINLHRETHRFGNQRDVVYSLAFNETGRLLASGDRDAHIILRDVVTSEEGEPIGAAKPGYMVKDIRFQRDRLISWSAEGCVRFWTVHGLTLSEDEDKRCTPAGISPWITTLGASGLRLATVSETGGEVGMYNVKKGRNLEFNPQGSTAGEVISLAVSPCERIVASAGQDWTVRLWDVERRTEAISLTTEPDKARWLAFDPSTSQFAVGLSSGRVFLYDVPWP